MRDDSIKYLFRADDGYNGGDINCKDCNSDIGITDHIYRGSTLKTKYISMTKSIGRAAYHYSLGDKKHIRENRTPIILIDYNNIPEKDKENRIREFYNFNNQEDLDKLKSTRPANFARGAQEVVTSYSIPQECIREIPPIFVDIIYAFEEHKEIQEILCDMVFSEKYEDITKLITKTMKFNDIERKFMESYYDIEFEGDGNIVRKSGKKLPKLGTVTKTILQPYMKEKFGDIMGKSTTINSDEIGNSDISEYIRVQILKNIIGRTEFRNIIGKEIIKNRDISQMDKKEIEFLVRCSNILKSPQYLGVIEGRYNHMMAMKTYSGRIDKAKSSSATESQSMSGYMMPGGLYIEYKDMKGLNGERSIVLPCGINYVIDEYGNVEGYDPISMKIAKERGEKKYEITHREVALKEMKKREEIERLGIKCLAETDVNVEERAKFMKLIRNFVKSKGLRNTLEER